MIGTVLFEPLEFPWTGEDNVQKTILWIKQEKKSRQFLEGHNFFYNEYLVDKYLEWTFYQKLINNQTGHVYDTVLNYEPIAFTFI